MRNAMLIIHILAVALWLGGSVMNGVINAKIAKSDDVGAKAALAKSEVSLGTQFYMPAAIVTLLSGIVLVLVSDGAYDFASIWVTVGVLSIIVAAVLGPVKFLPLSRQIADGYASGDTASAEAAVKQITMWSSLNTGLIALALILMVIKP